VQLRTQKIAGGAQSKLNKMYGTNSHSRWGFLVRTNTQHSHDVRKSIARVLTIINANQRHQLRLYYEKKKYLPLDLRSKQTRAMRRALTTKEASLVTEKQKKRQRHFPERNYAIKAE